MTLLMAGETNWRVSFHEVGGERLLFDRLVEFDDEEGFSEVMEFALSWLPDIGWVESCSDGSDFDVVDNPTSMVPAVFHEWMRSVSALDS